MSDAQRAPLQLKIGPAGFEPTTCRHGDCSSIVIDQARRDGLLWICPELLHSVLVVVMKIQGRIWIFGFIVAGTGNQHRTYGER